MPFVTILSARTIVLATQDSLVMERLAKISTSAVHLLPHVTSTPPVRTRKDLTFVPANPDSLGTEKRVKMILMNAATDPMTAFLTLLPAQILLDHTGVLVNQDMREMET